MAERSSFDRSSLEIPTSPNPAQRSSETYDGNEVQAAAAKEADPAYDSVVQSDVPCRTACVVQTDKLRLVSTPS